MTSVEYGFGWDDIGSDLPQVVEESMLPWKISGAVNATFNSFNTYF